MVENTSIAKALIDCVSRYAIRALFMGAPRSSFTRLFKAADVPSCVLKGAPDFCNIYIISRGKLSSMRAASRPLPTTLPAVERPLHNLNDGVENDMSPLDRPRASDNSGLYEELDLNASFAGSGRPSTSSSILSFYESLGSEMVHRRAKSSDFDNRSFERTLSMINMEDMEDKIRRLELELKHTMDNYHAACEEAFIAKQKARELQYWKMGEEQRLEAAIAAERAALLIAEKEREKSKAAVEAAEAAERAVELEAHKRADAEKKALREAEEKKKVLDALGHASILFRYQSLFHFLFLLALFFFVYGLEKKLS